MFKITIAIKTSMFNAAIAIKTADIINSSSHSLQRIGRNLNLYLKSANNGKYHTLDALVLLVSIPFKMSILS